MKQICLSFNVSKGKFKHFESIDEECSNCDSDTQGNICYHLSNNVIGLYLQLCEKCYIKLRGKIQEQK